jgi:hypothetical protein
MSRGREELVFFTPSRARRTVAEAVGTMFLLAAVVGSGIMGDRLVHVLDVVCKPGRDDRARLHEHVRWHPPIGCSWLHRRPIRRRRVGRVAVLVADGAGL